MAILDDDKEGFLRSERSLIQTIGRAARHLNGKAILYADKVTDSMKKAISETTRRRDVQIAHNLEHGITPRGVQKRIKDMIEGIYDPDAARDGIKAAQDEVRYESMTEKQLGSALKKLEKDMLEAARNLEFERAAKLRDELKALKQRLFVSGE